MAAVGRVPVGGHGAGAQLLPLRRVPVGARRLQPGRVALHPVRRPRRGAVRDVRGRAVRWRAGLDRPARRVPYAARPPVPAGPRLRPGRRRRRAGAGVRGAPARRRGQDGARRHRAGQRAGARHDAVRRRARRRAAQPHHQGARDGAGRTRGRLPRPDLVALPENSTDIDPYRNEFARGTIDAAVKDIGVPVLVGAVVAIGEKQRATRSLVWDPVTGPGAYYDKQQLVPFGEFTPFQDLVLALFERARLVGRQSVAGTRPGDLRMGPVTIGAVNCYEVAFDGTVRETVRAGGTPLVVQTNNATYALSNLPPQQLAMSKLRAVEHNRAIVTAATTGISAYVRPDGHVAWSTGELIADMTVVTVPVRTEQTIATRVGAVPEWALVIMGAAALGAAAWLARGERARRGAGEAVTEGVREGEDS
ncbi:apolipoprotein N-acyltransferase [Thermocatellispora tengchongensis]|uniref:apolipoprotein N-acyltransferase n=1 Tax=Thermocatellispora tengchongensis TaxID=1073253 RepID=UPI00363BD7E1